MVQTLDLSYIDLHNLNQFITSRLVRSFSLPLLPIKSLLTTQFLERLFTLLLGFFARVYINMRQHMHLSHHLFPSRRPIVFLPHTVAACGVVWDGLTRIAQIRLMSLRLMTLILNTIVDVLIGFGEAGGSDVLVGDGV